MRRAESKVSRLGRFVLVAALMVASAWIAAGCGETVIDSAKIEDQAKSNLEKTLPKTLEAGKRGEEFAKELGIKPGEKISSINCPSPKVEANTTFSCTVTFANGQQAEESFKIINKNADVEVLNLKPSK